MADWTAIEAEYRAGTRSVNAMAKDHGISEGTIRARAKKNGWVRDAAGKVRQAVNDKLAAGLAADGFSNSTANCEVRKLMDEAARSGVADMEMGLSNARRVLGRVEEMLACVDEPKDLKILNDANAGAIETIRRIRQLDEPANGLQAGVTVRYVD